MTPPRCRRCDGRLAEGFVAGQSDSADTVGQWHPDAPAKHWWGGLKVEKKRLVTITAFRCGRCGLLELYAPG